MLNAGVSTRSENLQRGWCGTLTAEQCIGYEIAGDSGQRGGAA